MHRITFLSVLIGFLVGLTLGCGPTKGPEVVVADTGKSTNSGDPPQVLKKDELPAKKARLAELEKAIAAKEKELTDLKAEADMLRQAIARAETSNDKVYRTAKELLADMPKEAFPKAGQDEGVSRADARKWVGKHLVFRTVEWTATVKSVAISGDGHFEVTLETDAPHKRLDHDLGYNSVLHGGDNPVVFGDVSLGAQDCRVFLWARTLGYGTLSYTCTRDETKRIQALKDKKVTFRATIQQASVLDKEHDSRLPIAVWTTVPSLDGFLPEFQAGGGYDFPRGTFIKEGSSDVTLRFESGRATLLRGKAEPITYVSHVSNPRLNDGDQLVAIFEPPYTRSLTLFSWRYDNKVLTLSHRGADAHPVLSGKWKLKE